MVLKLNNGWAFVHVPKTGGVWVREVLTTLGLVDEPDRGDMPLVEYPEWPTYPVAPRQTLRQHATCKMVGHDPARAFAFVREPCSWYLSNWLYTVGHHGLSVYMATGPAWNGFDCLAPAPFMEWVERCLAFYPEGPVARLFDTFTKGLAFVGRMENLEEDMRRVLDLMGIHVPLPDIPPRNTCAELPHSTDPLVLDLCRFSEEIIDKIHEVEHRVYEKFHYHKPGVAELPVGKRESRYCPVCEHHVDHFESFGWDPRPDAMCPLCGTVERHRLLCLWLNRTKVYDGSLVMDIAPEPGLRNVLRRKHAPRYVSVDISGQYDETVDITNIFYPSNTLDLILCSHVLEHVHDDARALSELHRVLKPGGTLIVQVPLSGREHTLEMTDVPEEKREETFGPQGHVRNYGRDFDQVLARFGFKVRVIHPEDFLDITEIREMSITPAAGELYLATKG